VTVQVEQRQGLRWTLIRRLPGDDRPPRHLNSDVEVIGDDLPGRTLVMRVSEHEAALADFKARLLSEGIEAAARAAYKRSFQNATTRPYRESDWQETADTATREYFLNLVAPVVEAAAVAAQSTEVGGDS
jgi:hypothetical protein